MQYLLEPARQRTGSKIENKVVNRLVVITSGCTRRTIAVREYSAGDQFSQQFLEVVDCARRICRIWRVDVDSCVLLCGFAVVGCWGIRGTWFLGHMCLFLVEG